MATFIKLTDADHHGPWYVNPDDIAAYGQCISHNYAATVILRGGGTIVVAETVDEVAEKIDGGRSAYVRAIVEAQEARAKSAEVQ